MLAELDKPVKGVPTSGIVKVSFGDYTGQLENYYSLYISVFQLFQPEHFFFSI